MDIAVREKKYDCFGLGIDRDRKAEHIKLALRNRNRDSMSVLEVDLFLVKVLCFQNEDRDT